MSHIKHMHEMIEKLVDCTKQAIENDETCVGQYPIGDVVDMIKDLNEAEYYAHISKAMDEAKEEEEEEEKYMLRKMKEEYGEEDGKRFYDEWRYKTTGRYAPKGRGTRVGRRGYIEPSYWHMNPEVYDGFEPEHYRDMDKTAGHLYYTESGNRSNSNSSNSDGRSSGNMSRDMGGTRNYGGDGRGDSKRSENRSESRYDRARRGYEETKMTHGGNNPEDKQHRMRELDSYVKELGEDITDMIADASQEEKTLLKQKIQGLAQRIS